jgi:photosystem II stability/assembly factor-like uncharacterized protein
MDFRILIRQLIKLVLAIAVAVLSFEIDPIRFVEAREAKPVQLRQFDLLNATSGWVLLDQHLFWTSDAGKTWEELSPLLPPHADIQDVVFLDSDTGWAVWNTDNSDVTERFELAQTTDHGTTWISQPLVLFEEGETASYAQNVQMDWLDPQTGWISITQASGSNFSVGSLLITTDGGESWRRSPLPVAGEVIFSDPQNGWVVGGPSGNQVFGTTDAGISWKNYTLTDIPGEIQASAYPPFVSGREGLLLMKTLGAESHLNVYSLNDSSDSWSLASQARLAGEPGVIGLSILDTQNFVAAIPGSSSLLRMVNGRFDEVQNEDGLSKSIVELDMVSLEVGWAKGIESTCSTGDTSGIRTCTASVRLLHTQDGGVNWQSIQLPLIQSDRISIDYPGMDSSSVGAGEISTLENTEVFIGQGFDRCEIPSLSQMQTWWNSSPYKTVNLYIGGSSRACANSVLTSNYLFQLYQQGWKFIPTWVGPQAPCTGYFSRMSSDASTAYSQGIDQANLAVDRLAELGLTGPQKTGSVIYYDIEAYGTNPACRAAVNAFMNGWVSQVHARGSLAGVYGSTLCNTGLSDFIQIANVPDVIWPARWYHNLGSGFYDPDASVWNLGSCIPNTAWANHQRIRQYEGDHEETWGGLTLDIDSNVLDGVVAIPFEYPYVSRVTRLDPNPTQTANIRFLVTFNKTVSGVGINDFTLTTAGVTGAFITSVSGSGMSYTVMVSTGMGNGLIRLDVVDDDSIKDGSSSPLGGAGVGNGSYNSGETYNKVIGADTLGVFRPSNGVIFLKNSNTTGFADVALNYGLAGDYPVTGDWDGDGDDTIGVYRNGRFLLRNSNSVGFAEFNFLFGQAGDQPIAGDWDGDGDDTIGVFRPSTGQFLLRNSNSAGPVNVTFFLGNVGDVGIAGDWNGDGIDTTGVFRPSNGVIFLKNTNQSGFANVALNYGLPGDKPVVGDWDNDGDTTIGIYRSNRFYLRNSNTNGFADTILDLGNTGDMPIAGNWDGVP